ncbi:hypothetical protein N4R57_18960 [Rhodobacteraceae bacterium D3-12]|nr:hypothetical protein N4R57_18960 [Rhodobacteraceae bacterium D3-12]
MDHDLALVIGLVVGVFSIPAIVSSFAERRTPRVAAITLIISGGLLAWAMTQKPGGYKIDQVPNVVVKVVGRFVN